VRRTGGAASALLAAVIVAMAGPAAVGCTAANPPGPQQPIQAPSPAPGGHA
jgi:hypothetical protein